jgi:hypothetical protein
VRVIENMKCEDNSWASHRSPLYASDQLHRLQDCLIERKYFTTKTFVAKQRKKIWNLCCERKVSLLCYLSPTTSNYKVYMTVGSAMRVEILCPENIRKLPGKREVSKSGEKSIWYRLPIIILASLVRGQIENGHIFRAQNSYFHAEPTDCPSTQRI